MLQECIRAFEAESSYRPDRAWFLHPANAAFGCWRYRSEVFVRSETFWRQSQRCGRLQGRESTSQYWQAQGQLLLMVLLEWRQLAPPKSRFQFEFLMFIPKITISAPYSLKWNLGLLNLQGKGQAHASLGNKMQIYLIPWSNFFLSYQKTSKSYWSC